MISESYVLEVDKQGEGSTDLHDTEVIKLSEVERESYITLFSSVLISHKDLVQAEKLGEGEFYALPTIVLHYLCYSVFMHMMMI